MSTSINRLITTHSTESTADSPPKAIFHPLSGPKPLVRYADSFSMGVVYTTEPEPDLNNDADFDVHRKALEGGKMELSFPGHVVARVVEFEPSPEVEGEVFMHRTQSLDFGVVLEGERTF
jgi:hypothetical protein